MDGLLTSNFLRMLCSQKLGSISPSYLTQRYVVVLGRRTTSTVHTVLIAEHRYRQPCQGSMTVNVYLHLSNHCRDLKNQSSTWMIATMMHALNWSKMIVKRFLLLLLQDTWVTTTLYVDLTDSARSYAMLSTYYLYTYEYVL